MPNGIYNNINCDKDRHPKFTPQQHQKKLLEYFLKKSIYKGLLAFHRLGSGKSCSSILISDEMIKKSQITKVYVLTPGSLRQNFIEEYCEKCGYTPEYLKKYYTFITTNYRVGHILPNFDNSLVIIDEVHNLINGVKNQSTHATLIYNKLMSSECRILALTGTPVYNYIWEWPLLGNLLKPKTFEDIIRENREIDEHAFLTQFNIDKEGNITPKQPKIFNFKLKGIISYFPGIGGGYYPKVIHEKPIQVQMSPLQDEEYWKKHYQEEKIRKMGMPTNASRIKNPKKYRQDMARYIVATKYIISRSVSNFFYPPQIRTLSNYKYDNEESKTEDDDSKDNNLHNSLQLYSIGLCFSFFFNAV